MIQELLGGASVTPTIGESKISIPFSCSPSSSPPTPILSPPTSTPKNNSNSNSNSNGNSEGSQSLRCPRCDSTNTKFCYYNNYNLTQPRHFCKTCRRYWTKGGTLRNVPIGGGCRKNKAATSSATSAASKASSAGGAMAKAKASLSAELLIGGGGGPGFFPDPSPPGLWASLPPGQAQPSSSHILALLRGASHQFPNPNPSPPAPMSSLGLDTYGNGSSLLGSFSRSNHPAANGFGLGLGASDFTHHSNGNSNNSNILELYQRLKSTAGSYGSYCGGEGPGAGILGNVVGPTPTPPCSGMSPMLFEGAGPVGDALGGYGMMMGSPGISSWSDFPTVPINGAFP